MRILLIGCGVMGHGFLKSCVKRGDEIVVVQPSLSKQLSYKEYKNVRFTASSKEIGDFVPDIVFFAVKPQMFDQSLVGLEKYCHVAQVVISILSGFRIETLKNRIGTSVPIVRVMPNVGLSYGDSVTLCFMNGENQEIKKLTDDVFSGCGTNYWMKDEDLLSHLTPICGSGPAYFFLLGEVMADCIETLGIEKDQAQGMAQQVMRGAMRLVDEEKKDFKRFKESVCSKGGVTLAALSVLDPSLRQAMKESLKKAWDREKELDG